MTGHVWQRQKTDLSPLVQKWQIIVLIMLCCGFVHTTQLRADLPHVVIILVDDMGYGDPGCYNADSKIPTPHIDGLARAGMKFTDAHASGPLCPHVAVRIDDRPISVSRQCGRVEKTTFDWIEPNDDCVLAASKRLSHSHGWQMASGLCRKWLRPAFTRWSGARGLQQLFRYSSVDRHSTVFLHSR